MSIENDPAYSHESGYEPYCMQCRTMQRMKRMDYGWKCIGYCGNEIDKNKERRAESPLNIPSICYWLNSIYGDLVYFDGEGKPKRIRPLDGFDTI